MVFSDIIIDVHTLEPIHYHNGASAVQGPFKKVVQHKYLERDEVKVWKEIDNNHSENYFATKTAKFQGPSTSTYSKF